MTLEQLKDKAKDWFFTFEDGFGYSVDNAASGGDLHSKEFVRELLTPKLDYLIDSTHQATVEEIIKIAEALPSASLPDSYSESDDIISRSSLIQAIKK